MAVVDPAACAAAAMPMVEGVARAALLAVRVRGISRTVYLGGFASASFPDKTQNQLSSLSPGESFSVRWNDAVFHGTDDVLGPITAKIIPGATSSSGGTVSSLASTDLLGTVVPVDFFPALNRNEFEFEVSLPRFGMVMRSGAPLVNSAVIREIPPVGSVYELESPVSFSAVDQGFLAAVFGEVEITACNVKLHVNGGLEARILSAQEADDHVELEVAIKNVSDRQELDVTWMMWPRPPAEFEHPQGTVALAGDRVEVVKVRAQRDMFYEARWIAFASARPFEASASTAVRVPGLS